MLNYSQKKLIISGGETEREPTSDIKYPAWNSSHETLTAKEVLRILV